MSPSAPRPASTALRQTPNSPCMACNNFLGPARALPPMTAWQVRGSFEPFGPSAYLGGAPHLINSPLAPPTTPPVNSSQSRTTHDSLCWQSSSTFSLVATQPCVYSTTSITLLFLSTRTTLNSKCLGFAGPGGIHCPYMASGQDQAEEPVGS